MEKSFIPKKLDRVLAAFMAGRSFNRFDAERELSDHCLHSTVSEIQGKYGDVVSREWEVVPGYRSIPTRCKRYWIPAENRQLIEKLKRQNEKALNSSDQTLEKGNPNYKNDSNLNGENQQKMPKK